MTRPRTSSPVQVYGTNDILPDRPLGPLPDHWRNLSTVFVRQARAHFNVEAISDSSGEKLTYGETLQKALALSRVLARQFDGSENVGIMLPPSVPAVLVNLAVTLLGKVAVNLPYPSGGTVVDSCIERTGITQVISTKELLDKMHLAPNANLIEVKELKDKVTALDKGWAWTASRYIPEALLATLLPGMQRNLDDLATIIFTTGSTDLPKGVMLSYSNLLHNIRQIRDHGNMRDDEAVLGILPFFHSLGYTFSIWSVLCLGLEATYHPNPLEAKKIGELLEEHGITIMVCTPTLMRPMLKRCTKEQFTSVRWLLLGAEKLQPELARDIEEILGKKPVEGYGLTQLTPFAGANIPSDVKTPDGRTVYGNKLGSVGQLARGTAIKILDPDSGDLIPRGSNKPGVIHLRGPQVMMGYYGQPEETARVLDREGWFNTEDVGYMDEDGFLHITDRLSRFAKIGGEMVPLGKIESAICKVTGAKEDAVVLTVLPDKIKGEKIAVIYTAELGRTPQEVTTLLAATDLSKLWIPSASNFVRVEKLPVGSTGKLDLRAVKQIAREALADK